MSRRRLIYFFEREAFAIHWVMAQEVRCGAATDRDERVGRDLSTEWARVGFGLMFSQCTENALLFQIVYPLKAGKVENLRLSTYEMYANTHTNTHAH